MTACGHRAEGRGEANHLKLGLRTGRAHVECGGGAGHIRADIKPEAARVMVRACTLVRLWFNVVITGGCQIQERG